jgi:hypothetical protein
VYAVTERIRLMARSESVPRGRPDVLLTVGVTIGLFRLYDATRPS